MTALTDHALSAMELYRQTKEEMDCDLKLTLDVADENGKRLAVVFDTPEMIPMIVQTVRERVSGVVAALCSDAFIRSYDLDHETLPPSLAPGQLQDEYLHDERIKEVLTVCAVDLAGEVALVQIRYGRNDDGSLYFDEPEIPQAVGGGLVELMRMAMMSPL